MDAQDKFEAVTGITDFMVAFVALPCMVSILRNYKKSAAPISAFLAFVFCLFGVYACLAGGVYHLRLREYEDQPYYNLLWPSVAISASIGLAAHALAPQFEESAPFSRFHTLRFLFCFFIVSGAATSIVVAQMYDGLFLPTLLWQLGAMGLHMLTYLWVAIASRNRRKQALLLVLSDVLYLAAQCVTSLQSSSL